jgi:tetratricopeptide (TPR) repeat protein
VICILLAIAALVVIGIKVKGILNSSDTNGVVIDEQVSEEKIDSKMEDESPKGTNDTGEKGETKNEGLVDFNALESAIASKDYETIYNDVKMINESSLKGKEKTIYYSAKEALKNDGANYFYKKGSEFYNNKSFMEAKSEFVKGYEYGEGNYIYPHIVFFKAATDEQLGSVNEAINGYEEFYNKFKNENYIEETIYKLALLYKDKDIDKSIMFAKEIRERYPSSMYNNKVISNLLDNK